MFVVAPLALAAALTACGGSDRPSQLLTLEGAAPLIIGHRGLPGLYPEETLPAYEGAIDAGADSLEEDLHLTNLTVSGQFSGLAGHLCLGLA